MSTTLPSYSLVHEYRYNTRSFGQLCLEKNYKEWAEHILNKFGNEGAFQYAISGSSCPCQALGRGCKFCRFGSIIYCAGSRAFADFPRALIPAIKKEILKRLDND